MSATIISEAKKYYEIIGHIYYKIIPYNTQFNKVFLIDL